MEKIWKRIVREAEDNLVPGDNFYLQPLKDNLYNWHFTFKGNENSVYDKGLYHGALLLTEKYPFSPPDILFFNKSGRFHINNKICLSITSYHKEQWSPMWSLKKIMVAVSAFFHDEERGIGYIKLPDEQRRELAMLSRSYKCNECG